MKKITAQIAPPRMRTIKETAKITGVPEYRIRVMCRERQIAAIQNGKRWLVNLDRFIDYLNNPNGGRVS